MSFGPFIGVSLKFINGRKEEIGHGLACLDPFSDGSHRVIVAATSVSGFVVDAGWRELVRLVAPAIPAGTRRAGEQFEVWPCHQSFYPLRHAVRLATVLPARL